MLSGFELYPRWVPLTNVAQVQILALMPYVGLLLVLSFAPRGFSPDTLVSPLLELYYILFIYVDICEEYCGSPVFQCIILALLNYTKLNYTKSHHYRYTCMLPFERKYTFNTARDFQRNYVNLGLTE